MPTLLAAELFEGSKIVTVAAGCYHTMAVGENGALWTWNARSSSQLGLGDTNNRRVTLVGAEEVFGGSQVRTVACGGDHKLAVTETGKLWAWGYGAQGRLGLNDGARQAGADARARALRRPEGAGAGGGRGGRRAVQQYYASLQGSERAQNERERERKGGREGGRERERERARARERERERARERESARARAREREQQAQLMIIQFCYKLNLSPF